MSKSRQHLYEGMYILSATLSEDARKKALEKLTGTIQQFAGEVRKVFEQGRRKMAYEVEGRREGFYFVIYFTVPSANMIELEREYKLNEDLIRFMTMRAPEIPETLEFKPLEREQ